MLCLIVKEDVGAKRLQDFMLGQVAQEEHLINSHVPRAQCTDDTFVCGAVSGRH
jgi:hypothetical protein